MPAPSPAASSVADDSIDDKSRLESPSWANQGQRTPLPPGTQTPSAPPQMHPAGPPPPGGMMMHPGMMPPQGMMPPVMQPTPPSGPRKESIVDKLVTNPPRVMPERRMFFERLVQFCEQHGEPITMIPQVSKQNVDLHRLYIGVRNRGGFEQVCSF
ncbi:unnamed protein product [Strongylus vulgaris]|uniref:ARID domain-containing protein n=1 Tax=Strongylus vulgaris TaxID=40348 RepID=A0A3P7L183_STRVU|nr:unnamed protein product [Strongylus vulgaris]